MERSANKNEVWSPSWCQIIYSSPARQGWFYATMLGIAGLPWLCGHGDSRLETCQRNGVADNHVCVRIECTVAHITGYSHDYIGCLAVQELS